MGKSQQRPSHYSSIHLLRSELKSRRIISRKQSVEEEEEAAAAQEEDDAMAAMRKELLTAASVVAATGIALALVWYRRSAKQWKRARSIVIDFREDCDMPVSKMWDIADAMAAEMRAGLMSDESGFSSLRMLASPLDSFLTGNEEGIFYGLEMGRTKVCVFRVQLAGKELGIAKKELMEVPVPMNLMVGTSEEVYNYLAAQLVKFMSSSTGSSSLPGVKPKEIGVTFSFPVINSAEHGIHVEWNRGFSIKENVGRDSLAMINEAMAKHGVGIHISCLVNDTIGTLVGGRYCSSDTVAAIILGNGTNAAYLEPVESVPKWHGPRPKDGHMVINIEWGDFLSSHLPVTEFDIQLDNESPRPGEQIFEKLISGMYLGDIVRRALLKLAEETALFGDSIPLKLRIPFALRTTDVAYMHQDSSSSLCVVAEKLEKALGIHDTNWTMRKTVVQVCDIVTKRAARLAGAAIVGILKKLGRDGTDKKAVVAVEGGLYEHYGLFRTYLHGGVKEMLQGKVSDNVVIEHRPDVGGVGSALLSVPSSHE